MKKSKDYSVFDHMIEGVQVISPDWRYIYVNSAVAEQGKYTREELQGHTMMEKYPGIEKTPMFKTLEQCMQNRIPDKIENEFTFPDGSVGYFELRIEPVPEGMLILSIDITSRKKAELEKQERIQGLEKIVFMTSHRVRQPVANILGLSYILKKSKYSKQELIRVINFMDRAAQSLDIFTKELTDFVNNEELRAKG